MAEVVTEDDVAWAAADGDLVFDGDAQEQPLMWRWQQGYAGDWLGGLTAATVAVAHAVWGPEPEGFIPAVSPRLNPNPNPNPTPNSTLHHHPKP